MFDDIYNVIIKENEGHNVPAASSNGPFYDVREEPVSIMPYLVYSVENENVVYEIWKDTFALDYDSHKKYLRFGWYLMQEYNCIRIFGNRLEGKKMRKWNQN